jgi:amino-acid N-acetyltransferase
MRANEREAVEALLRAAGLPIEGVAEHIQSFFAALTAGALVGVVGMEYYGDVALLRSATVVDSARGRGIGSLLTAHALHAAEQRGVARVYLLTETAERFFQRHGFRSIPRSEAAPELSASAEFRGCCPETAVCMMWEAARR